MGHGSSLMEAKAEFRELRGNEVGTLEDAADGLAQLAFLYKPGPSAQG